MAEPDDLAQVEGEQATTYFAIVPEWVLMHPSVGPREVQVYCWIDRHTDKQGLGEAFPSLRRLAELCDCDQATVRRARDKLCAIQALEIYERRRKDGSKTSNGHRLRRDPPARLMQGGPCISARGGPSISARTMNKSQKDLEKSDRANTALSLSTGGTPALDERLPRSVNRKPVKSEEGALAVAVLNEWNAQTRQEYRGGDWLKTIIMRIREWPEMGIQEHAHIISVALADPWWEGAASPSVVYGNGKVFEKSVMSAKRQLGPQRKKPSRGAAGVASALIEDVERRLHGA